MRLRPALEQVLERFPDDAFALRAGDLLQRRELVEVLLDQELAHGLQLCRVIAECADGGVLSSGRGGKTLAKGARTVHIRPEIGGGVAELDADGLPVGEAGAWTLDKHERLRKYVDSAHGARRKFAKRAYIDLYCGAGRTRIRETGEIVDGSPLVAWKAGAQHGDQFTEFLLGDSDPVLLAAAEARLRNLGAKVRIFPGEAHQIVDDVIKAVDPGGLHLALLDPFNLGDLPFSVIQKLAGVKRMDLLIHVSAMDLKRDLHNYLKMDGPKHLDRFAPGWREHVDVTQRADLIRSAIFAHWQSLITSLGTEPNDKVEVVENSKSSDLYWLVFVARHALAHKLWSDIANVTPQGRLFG